MYWKYVARRLVYGILMYVLLLLMYSALFNQVADVTLRSSIQEQMAAYDRAQAQHPGISAEQLQARHAEHMQYLIHTNRLDQPLATRILWRTIDTLTFNFGNATHMRSAAGETKVAVIVGDAIPRTLLLFGVATVFDILLGVWLGLRNARRAGKLLDRTTSIFTMVVYGMPTWWLGMILIMLFVYTIPIFPSGGLHSVPTPHGFAAFLDLLRHLVLPVMTFVVLGFWGRAYLTRNIVLGTLQEDYIMSARARGLPERTILFGHTLRSAAPPIVTMALLSLVFAVGGAIIFEGIFSWPGMGNLYWVAVQQNDLPVLMGNLAATTALYLIALVVLDLIYGFLDPRIKVSGKA